MIVAGVGMGGIGRIQIGHGNGLIGIDKGVSNQMFPWRAGRKGKIYEIQRLGCSGGPRLKIRLLNSYRAIDLIEGKDETGGEDHSLVMGNLAVFFPFGDLVADGVSLRAIGGLPHLYDTALGGHDVAILSRDPVGLGI
jgi:hypothetical protein